MKNLIPHFIHDNFKAGNFSGQFEAATLFVDISGFTPMTEALMQFGDEGAEILSGILNRVFQAMVNAVYQRGGFITLFAGDAFTAIFPIGQPCEGLEPSQGLVALTCARRIQTIFKQQGLQRTKAGDFALAVKVGASFGRVEWGIVGGGETLRRLDVSDPEVEQKSLRKVGAMDSGAAFYFRGPAIDGCAAAEHYAEKSQITFDESIKKPTFSEKVGFCLPVADGFYRLLSIPRQRISKSQRFGKSAGRQRNAIVRRFLPDAVVDFKGQGEFRNVVSIFISFDGVANHDELNRFASILIKNQTRFGGYLKEIDFGDKGGVAIVFFGAPVAFEKNVERALDFISALKWDLPNKIPGTSKVPGILMGISGLRWRAGITYGLTFAGIIGGRQRCQYSPMGATVNLAARLMMKADWGAVWLTEQVQCYVGNSYEIEFINDIVYKGIADPAPTYKLLAAKAQVASLYRGQFVGRQAEVDQLLAWAQPIFGDSPFEGGQGDDNASPAPDKSSPSIPLQRGKKFAGIVYIYGAPGGGKSRLVHEVTEQVRDRCVILRLHTDSILQKSFNPIVYFLKDYFDQAPQLTHVENKARFEQKYDQLLESLNPISVPNAYRVELQRTRSIIGALLDHYWDKSLYDILAPKDRYDNTISALKTLFQALSRLRPIIILVEDLQWIDPDTPKLFTRLTRRLDDFPILILVTGRYRDDGSKPVLPVDKDVTCHTIELGGLPDDSLTTVIEDQLQAAVAPEAARFIADKSGHNPFFAGQYANYLKEQGLLLLDKPFDNAQGKGVYHLPPTMAEVGLPATLTDLLIARLDRLQPRLKELVKTAAVIGREFETSFLLTVIRQLDPAFSLAQFYPALENAAQEQVWSAIEEIHYIFNHVLLRDAAYQMQLKARLRQLHGLIAETIEQLNPDDPTYFADVAFHYEKAERLEPAKAFYDKAGQTAQDKYTRDLAHQYFTAALKLCIQLHGENHTETANAYSKAGKICELQAKNDRALDAYQKTLAIRLELLGEKHPDTASSYNDIGVVCLNKGESDRAQDYFQKALANRQELLGEKHPHTAKSYNNIGLVYNYKGEYDRALDYYQKSLAIKLELLGEKHPNTAKSYNNIGLVYRAKGEYDRALEYQQKALAIQLELLGEKHTDTAAGYDNIGLVYRNKGEYNQALDYHQRSLTIMKKLVGEKHPSTAVSYNNIGLVYRAKGEYDRALEYQQKALAIQLELLGEKHLHTAMSYDNIGLIYMNKYEYDRALDYSQVALTLFRELLGERHTTTGYSYKINGTIYLNKGEYDRALEYLNKALAILVEAGATREIGESLSYLAHVYFYLQEDEKALATNLRHLQHIREIGHDVENGRTHLAIALVITNYELGIRNDNKKEMSSDSHRLLRDITALTALPETPAVYFEKAIETAGAKNYLTTLVPALYEYGRYLYQAGQPVLRQSSGLSHLRQAKEKATAAGMMGEVKKIEKICAEFGVTL